MLGEAALTGDDARRYFASYDACDPRDRRGRGGRRRVRGARDLDQAVRAAPAVRPRAARPRVRGTPAARDGAGAAGEGLRHRLQHRRRGGRPPRPLARPPRGAGGRSVARRLGRAGLRRAGVPEARARDGRLADRARAPPSPAAHGAARQGRVLGHRDQARAGGRPGRLSGVHAQGAHRRRVPRVREGDARRPPTRSTRSSRATTRTRSPPSTRWPGDADFEFQCLHGMGESVYDQVVRDRATSTARAGSTRRSDRTRRCSRTSCGGCSRTAPTRPSSTASSIPRCRIADLIADPVARARRDRRHAASAHSAARSTSIRTGSNSQGLDLSDEAVRARGRARSSPRRHGTRPRRCSRSPTERAPQRVARSAIPPTAPTSSATSRTPTRTTSQRPCAAPRAKATRGRDSRRRRARTCSSARPISSRANATRCSCSPCARRARRSATRVGEVREAVDFCRYYAAQARRELGGTRCRAGRSCASRRGTFRSRSSSARSSAALAAGNPVLAKPAEQTPLIAAAAVRILHRAGVPRGRAAAAAGPRRNGRRRAGRRSADRRRALHRVDRGRAARSTARSRAATTIRC